jgi:hypothetical protein
MYVVHLGSQVLLAFNQMKQLSYVSGWQSIVKYTKNYEL